jgi:8-oxo-dGTP diphosphatase
MTSDIIKLAGCIIQDNHGHVLLLHRNKPNRVQWETPGGKLNPDESPQAAAIREVREEIGLTPKIIKLIGQKDFIEDDRRFSYYWFIAKIDQDPVIQESSFDQIKYFSWTQMRAIFPQLSANTKNLLQAQEKKQLAW